MRKILVISGHPNLEASLANRTILDALEASGLDLEVRRLDALYPSYAIDVAAEQAALTGADAVVLAFPFYWYSVPALLKLWIDKVLTFGFAYGPGGDKLKGKDLYLSVTAGGPAEAYGPEGYNHHTTDALLLHLKQTASLTQLVWHPPRFVHAAVARDEDAKARIREAARAQAAALIAELR